MLISKTHISDESVFIERNGYILGKPIKIATVRYSTPPTIFEIFNENSSLALFPSDLNRRVGITPSISINKIAASYIKQGNVKFFETAEQVKRYARRHRSFFKVDDNHLDVYQPCYFSVKITKRSLLRLYNEKYHKSDLDLRSFWSWRTNLAEEKRADYYEVSSDNVRVSKGYFASKDLGDYILDEVNIP